MNELEIPEIDETPPVLELAPDEIDALADELVEYHAEFADLFYRVEQAHWANKYVQGLLLPLERKSIQPMALALEGGNIQAMQQFVGQGRWQDEPVLQQHGRLVNETLGEDDGVCIVDGSEFPKKGDHSVGAARQWCGRLGKVENCQAGVFAAYASRDGYTLLDRRLRVRVPEAWFDDDHRERWERCGIPDDTRFKTKPVLALDMLQEIVADGNLRFQWVTGDEDFGRNPGFLDGVAALDRWYFVEVPHNTRAWMKRPKTGVLAWSGHGPKPTRERVLLDEPAPQRVDELAAEIAPDEWTPYVIKEGSKGPMVAEFVFKRGVAIRGRPEGVPGPDVWIIFRRSLGDDPDLKVYLSNAPAEMPPAELVRIAGMRWPIESAIEESKDGLGMDHYEVRTWLGWHHHMTLCLLAHHFLVRTQKRLKKGLLR